MHLTKFLLVTLKDSVNTLSIGLIVTYKKSLSNNKILLLHLLYPNHTPFLIYLCTKFFSQ